ncbi:MAG: sigma-54-dependent Fis family transcriptional regulator [Planctomycetota bacterium]|nr:MAG: sigma-54-dependent Fis family transcriptional regulator [Planctomycetota bacterium]
MSRRALIVDDDVGHSEVLAEALERRGLEIRRVDSGKEAVQILGDGPEFAVVLTDLVMHEVDGFDVLEAARKRDPATQVLMLTGHGSREVAVEAMEKGALYYLEKPVDLGELRAKVDRALEAWERERQVLALKSDMQKISGLSGIIGRAPSMIRMVETIQQIATTQASVLILGESGTGKEVVARAIHELSSRRDKLFVALNCGGLSEGTIESELFGHVRGSFTGAAYDREGKFEYARGGTLFLDEVAEMPLQTQVKLLRVLEERKVIPVGSNDPIDVDVRVLAATHQKLAEKIEDGSFREDLFYRLKVVTIQIPPLRERKEDIPLLAEQFRKDFRKLHGRDIDGIDREVLKTFAQHDWPGNVRELRNIVESMVVRARGNILTVLDLPPELSPEPQPGQDGWAFLAGKHSSEVERNHLRVTLEMFQGNRVRAAQAMGISERTLYRKLKEYELTELGRE